MIEQLVELKKISHEEAQIYQLFSMDEVGRNYLNRMIFDTFMDQAPPPAMTSEILAYTEGRRSIFRELKLIINNIDKLLEGIYDGNSRITNE